MIRRWIRVERSRAGVRHHLEARRLQLGLDALAPELRADLGAHLLALGESHLEGETADLHQLERA